MLLSAQKEIVWTKKGLEVSEYLLIGCRKLIVETNAKCIHRMLNRQEMGLNALINRWIDKIILS